MITESVVKLGCWVVEADRTSSGESGVHWHSQAGLASLLEVFFQSQHWGRNPYSGDLSPEAAAALKGWWDLRERRGFWNQANLDSTNTLGEL